VHENRFAALGVAGVAVFFWLFVSFVVVVLAWVALSIYALVKAIGSAPDDANPRVVLLIVMGIVAFLTLGFAGAVRLIGRSMVSRRSEPAAMGFEDVGL
jgi:hypothetical protein